MFEREVAKDLGTTRTGPTGYGDPDVKFDPIAIECKAYSKLSLLKADLKQAKDNAKGRRWALLLKEKGTGVKLCVMPYGQFLEYAAYREEKDRRQAGHEKWLEKMGYFEHPKGDK